MAKAKVVTPDNLGNTFKKDESSQKYQVNVDNSTITVNDQGQLVSNSTSKVDEVVWTGNISTNESPKSITLSKSCLGKTLTFFLVESSSTNLTDSDAQVYIVSFIIPEKIKETGGIFSHIFYLNRYQAPQTRIFYPHQILVLFKTLSISVPAADGTIISIDGTTDYICKQITMS